MPQIGKSVLVAAHLDDEVLWFSSIASQVDTIIICYLDHASKPAKTKGRRQSLVGHPLDHLTCLPISSADVFGRAAFSKSVVTPHGISFRGAKEIQAKYQENYCTLEKSLDGMLENCERVYTHNPWGEYGHEEHIQVHRAVHSLQKKYRFSLQFSGYVGCDAYPWFVRYLPSISGDYQTVPTNTDLAQKVMQWYQQHDCWTWFDEWDWPDHEALLRYQDDISDVALDKNALPVNVLWTTARSGRRARRWRTVRRLQARIMRSLKPPTNDRDAK